MDGQQDLTVGSPSKILFKFALPFFIANLLQAMYMAVDLLVIGQFCEGAQPTASVANGGQVMMLLMLFVIGLSTGMTVIVGKYFGEKDHESMQRFIGSSLSLFFLLTLVLTGLAFALAPTLLRFINTPKEAVDGALTYIYICSAGLMFTILYNVASGILRGVGNSFFPMICVAAACVCNIIGDLVLIAVFHLDATGAAISTVASQAIGAVMTLSYLHYHPRIFRFHWNNLKLDKSHVVKLLAIGMPIAIQSILIDLSFMIIFAIVNEFGLNASAGYGVCGRLNGIILLPAMSMGMAMAPITSQNIGAKKYDRALQFFKLSVFYSTLIGLGLFVWMRYFPESAFAIFTRDQDVIAAGSQYMRSFCFEILVLGFVFSGNGFLNGSGHTRMSMTMNVFPTLLVRIPFAWFVSRMAGATLYGIGFASPLASFITVFLMAGYIATGRWKEERF
ncbi:MAG: MATE family efflux transporter [Thermoguttaceae bacterium]|nr:MATE family efflux transporter [Thermoguttaceae bacterium]